MTHIFFLLLPHKNKHWREKEFWKTRAKRNQWDAKRRKLARMLQAKSPRIQTQNVLVSTVCFCPFVFRGVTVARDGRRQLGKYLQKEVKMRKMLSVVSCQTACPFSSFSG